MIKEIEVFKIGQSVPSYSEIEHWLTTLGFDGRSLATDFASADCEPLDILVLCAAKRCYKAFDIGQNKNLTRVRNDVREHLTNVLRSGHGSVLEHVTFTFAIENVTRVLTGELNRHRAGVAISEGSGRYIRFNEDIDYRIPDCFEQSNSPDVSMEEARKRTQSRAVLDRVFAGIARNYAELEEIWADELEGDFAKKKELTSAFRRIVPMGHCTGGAWTFNIRALRHILTLRSSEHAEEEIREVSRKIFEIVERDCPIILSDLIIDDNGVITKEYMA